MRRAHGRPAAVRLAVLAAVAGLSAALLLMPSCGGAAAPRRPDVLLVVLDTVRADRCSLLGYPRPTTPRLDELAGDAVTFSDAWSPASWTAPAHATLFTGVDAHRLDLFRGADTILRGSVTLAERLEAAGWETALVSGNPWVGPETGLARGFSFVRHHFAEDAGYRSADRLADEALDWLRARRTDTARPPWFLYLNLMDAHAPYDPPDEATARFLRPGLAPEAVAAARRLNSPRGLCAASFEGRPLAPDVDAASSDLYDACVATADAQLGRLLDALRAGGVLDGAVVVVASDHGEGLGDHGWREHGLRMNRELLRVPLVVRRRGRFDGGRRVTTPVTLADVAPTVLACCGLEPGQGLDGRDLAASPPPRPAIAADRPFAGWPMLDADTTPAAWLRVLRSPFRSLYDGRFHLVADASGPVELYDVAADPSEARNLVAEHVGTAARLQVLLDAACPRR